MPFPLSFVNRNVSLCGVGRVCDSNDLPSERIMMYAKDEIVCDDFEDHGTIEVMCVKDKPVSLETTLLHVLSMVIMV